MTLSAGLGLKPVHYESALACAADGVWFEVHPENYFVEGGPRLAWLERVRCAHPLSLHGVSLSLAADADPDREQLERLALLVRRVEPALVSEHLAWSVWRGAYAPDLLPLPRTHEALLRVAANVGQLQDRLQRRIAIENPSHYLRLDGHDYDEIDFLVELGRRTGCALLLDVNNVAVSANNLGFDAAGYIDRLCRQAGQLPVAEVHLAGHSEDPTWGRRLLIDSHDAPVAEPVWTLYERLMQRIGPRPTLIERDDRLPSFDELLAERQRAHDVLLAARGHDADARAGEATPA
jgi:hypothetical protein